MRWSIGISYFFDTRWFQIKSQLIKNLILRGGDWGAEQEMSKVGARTEFANHTNRIK